MPTLLANASRAWTQFPGRSSAARARRAPCCTSLATAPRMAQLEQLVRFFAPSIEIVRFRPGTACPTTGFRPIAEHRWPSGWRRWRRLAGPGRQAPLLVDDGQRPGAARAAAGGGAAGTFADPPRRPNRSRRAGRPGSSATAIAAAARSSSAANMPSAAAGRRLPARRRASRCGWICSATTSKRSAPSTR